MSPTVAKGRSAASLRHGSRTDPGHSGAVGRVRARPRGGAQDGRGVVQVTWLSAWGHGPVTFCREPAAAPGSETCGSPEAEDGGGRPGLVSTMRRSFWKQRAGHTSMCMGTSHFGDTVSAFGGTPGGSQSICR